ncbi:MAG: hypothetical protein LBS54_00985 [Dysgonamonadaceae bacterium]|nr:hypothetical protein [Dysgonamonadaceae bacterium]
MKGDMFDRRKVALRVLFGMLVLSIACIFIKNLFEEWSFSSYQISEFLINYSGGFVRRGLLGEILLWFTRVTGVDVVWTIKVISVVCCVSVVWFFTVMFRRKGYPLYLIPLCFFCGGIVMSEVWIRKDFLMFCCFIPVLWIYGRTGLPLVVKVLLINLITVFMILTHEVFGLFTLPALFFLLYKSVKERGLPVAGSALLAAVSLLPSVIAFVMVTGVHGNGETAQIIWDSWCAVSGIEQSPLPGNNALAFLDSSGTETFRWHFGINFLREEHYLLPVWYWLAVVFTVYYISTNAALVFRKSPEAYTADDRLTFAAVWSFQFLCLLPMFIGLSIDYIRIFFYLTASSFALFLIIPKETLKGLFPTFWLNGINRLNLHLDRLLPPNRTVVTLLMLTVGISYSGFVLKTIWMSTALYRIFLLLSEPFLLLRDYVLQ